MDTDTDTFIRAFIFGYMLCKFQNLYFWGTFANLPYTESWMKRSISKKQKSTSVAHYTNKVTAHLSSKWCPEVGWLFHNTRGTNTKHSPHSHSHLGTHECWCTCGHVHTQLQHSKHDMLPHQKYIACLHWARQATQTQTTDHFNTQRRSQKHTASLQALQVSLVLAYWAYHTRSKKDLTTPT